MHTVIKRASIDTEDIRPFADRVLFSVIFQIYGVPAIVRLFFWSSPCAVIGAVVPVYISAF